MANLYGFDLAYAKKKGLKIGTVDAVVNGFDDNRKDFSFIMHIHEGVLSPTSTTTLISENQVHKN